MDYQEALAYIGGSTWFGAEAGLDRIRELLEALGRPQDHLKYVHIAGTNGKGSCAAMLSSILKASGYKTGLFTSPYIQRFNERMQINSRPIEDDSLTEIVSVVKPAAEAMAVHPTQFEMITACALLWFARENCDIAVLEVGLGGRYDATNVIAAPEAAVIMNIGLDHTQVLGNTLEQIAFEKAGIIKSGCDCVVYQQEKQAAEVIRHICKERNARLTEADFSALKEEFNSIDGQVFAYKGQTYALPLLGKNQLCNAAVVLETVDVLRKKGWNLDPDDVEHGLYSVSWPARFEIVSEDPFFVVDGGHNPQCARTVADNLLQYFPGYRRVILTGVMRDKDYPEIYRILSEVADEFICVSPPGSPRALPAAELAAQLETTGRKTTVCDNVREAVATAVDAAGKDGMVCAVGSLYLAGAIRTCFDLL